MNQPTTWRDLAASATGPGAQGGPQGPVTWRDLAHTDPAGGAPASSQPPAAPAPAPAAPPLPPGWGVVPGPHGEPVYVPPAAQQWAPPAAQPGGWAEAPWSPPAPPQAAPQAPPQAAPADPAAPLTGATAWDLAAQHGVTAATPQPTGQGTAPPDPAEASAALGMSIAGAGGAATDVDAGQLLAYIRRLEARFEQLQQAQAVQQAPEVVTYATALADHLQAKADANPVVNADADHTYYPALVQAAQLVNAARATAQTGQGHEQLVTLAKNVAGWVRLHARKFPAIDYEYILQLAEETAGAAVKLGSIVA